MIFVLIPGGTFAMGTRKASAEHPEGSANVDSNHMSQEGPVQTVKLDPFFLSKYEYSQGQHQICYGARPRRTHKEYRQGLLAVGAVNPEDADIIARQLQLTLPTEAQWEYACRAGTKTVWSTGDDVASLKGKANIADMSRQRRMGGPTHRYEQLEDGYIAECPIGSLEPNPFGLHNTLGNLAEITRDWWCEYGLVSAREGDGLREGDESDRAVRVARGGHYSDRALRARSGSRLRIRSNTPQLVLGIRFARPIDP